MGSTTAAGVGTILGGTGSQQPSPHPSAFRHTSKALSKRTLPHKPLEPPKPQQKPDDNGSSHLGSHPCVHLLSFPLPAASHCAQPPVLGQLRPFPFHRALQHSPQAVLGGKPTDYQKPVEQLLEGDGVLGFHHGGAQDSSQGKQEATQRRCIILQ